LESFSLTICDKHHYIGQKCDKKKNVTTPKIVK
jgi:hypothetical protein